MAFTLQQLKNELTNDPTARGYAGQPDNVCTGLINAQQAGITINRADITPAELLEAIDIRDFNATNATVAACAWFESVTQYPRIRLRNDDNTNTRVRSNLNRMLDDVQGSQTRFTALQTRQGSRAEQLWGRDTVITDADIGAARNLP